ncbi:hypothetical protein HanXRQr2_Chr01g0003741 [Helianthus annuus]|uniref:Uncharacterized protein n=1 Tax=Helianthus annuus TaxID=4232 RepID=A0A9K3JSJ5_HELAN|nr:hypothetical protein HanXRQr2_Chr01g0003741 [Helianthus annuus]
MVGGCEFPKIACKLISATSSCISSVLVVLLWGCISSVFVPSTSTLNIFSSYSFSFVLQFSFACTFTVLLPFNFQPSRWMFISDGPDDHVSVNLCF